MTALNTNRAFGIELEVLARPGSSREKIAAAIRAAEVSCNAEGYGHSVPTAWKVVTDGSLPQNRGMEVVSPKLYGEAGIAEARKVADALVAAGCTVTTQCGFHVHVDGSDFTPEQLAKVAVNYLWFETFFDHVMPESRRGSHNRYVQSNRSRFGGYGTDALNAGIERVANAAKGLGLYAQPVSHESVIRAFCGGDRYFKLNLVAFHRQGSIEFRQHSGTVEADKIEHWVRLTSAFVEKAKVSKPRPRKVIREWTAAEEMHLFFSVFALPEATRRFYMQRRRDLITAAKAAASLRADPIAYGRRVLAALEARAARIRGYARPHRNVLYRITNAISRLTRAIERQVAEQIFQAAEYAVANRLISATALTA